MAKAGQNEQFNNLLQQFQAECLPSIITDVLLVFFNPSKTTDYGKQIMEIDSLDSSSNSKNSIQFFHEQNQTTKEFELNEFTKTTQHKSIVDITGDIPEDFNSCTEYFDQYFDNGCGCSKQCHLKFPKSIAFKAHLDALDLDHYCPSHVNHQHLLLLGAMNALSKIHKINLKPARKRKPLNKGLSKSHTFFKFRGQDVCRKFFTYIFGCGDKRFKNIRKHFISNGIDSIKHESVYNYSLYKINSNRRRRDALIFIKNFAQQNALELPGRYGQSNDVWKNLYLLPNNHSKAFNFSRRYIYDQYISGCEQLKAEPISFALWNELWDLFYPNIQTVNNRQEPCFQCRQYQQSLVSQNCESPKLDSIKSYLDHLNWVKTELDYYKSIVTKCVETYKEYSQKQNFEKNLKESFRSTLNLMHYTLNWFTTISLPCDTKNPKIYFKNGYKIALFGIAVEPYRKFILYIIPEFISNQTSNLMNLILSILHHFFSIYQFGESESYLHLANNQLDQLKNSELFSYLIWRTILGRHDKFNVSSLPAGHSHCWNDLFLGALKQKFRKTRVNSLNEIKMIAEHCWLEKEKIQDSIFPNHGGYIQTYVVGEDPIPLYDWTSKLIFIQKIDSNLLNEYNHFQIGIESPGHILCRKTAESEISISHRVLSNENFSLINDELFTVLEITPLSIERKSYLYDTFGPTNLPFLSDIN